MAHVTEVERLRARMAELEAELEDRTRRAPARREALTEVRARRSRLREALAELGPRPVRPGSPTVRASIVGLGLVAVAATIAVVVPPSPNAATAASAPPPRSRPVVAIEVRPPTTVVFAVDASAGVKARRAVVEEAITRTVAALRDDGDVAVVVQGGSETRVVVPLRSVRQARGDLPGLLAATNEAAPPAMLHELIYAAWALVGELPGKSHVVLFASDGALAGEAVAAGQLVKSGLQTAAFVARGEAAPLVASTRFPWAASAAAGRPRARSVAEAARLWTEAAGPGTYFDLDAPDVAARFVATTFGAEPGTPGDAR